MNYIKLIKFRSVRAFVFVFIATFAYVTSAFAFGNGASNVNSLVDMIKGVPGADYSHSSSAVAVPNVEEGSHGYSHSDSTDDSYSFEAGTYYRRKTDLPFQKHIHTGGEKTVTVFDITMGVQGGIKLGCNGLDFGIEALFEFNGNELLDNLTSYITSQLAVEALAMLYATPLIATIMDGIKAMNNASRDFNMKGCNMQAVMDRRDEIRKEKFRDCLDAYTDENGQTNEPAFNECSDPTGLSKVINAGKKKVQNAVGLLELLELGYDEAIDAIAGAMPSDSRMKRMFVRDFKVNGDDESDFPTATVNIIDLYDDAQVLSNNYMIDINSALYESMGSRAADSKFVKDVRYAHKEYIDLILRYGPTNVFADSGRLYVLTEDKKERIQDKFADVSKVFKIATRRGKASKSEIFLIGPEDGLEYSGAGLQDTFYGKKSNLKDEGDDATTSLKDEAKESLEDAGSCWFSHIQKDAQGAEKNKWERLSHKNADVLQFFKFYKKGDIDKVVNIVTKCITLENMDLEEINTYKDLDKALSRLYMDYRSSYFALLSTETILETIKRKLKTAKSDHYRNTLKKCKTAKENDTQESLQYWNSAVYGKDTGQPFKNCKDYATQLGLKDEHIDFLKGERDRFESNLSSIRMLVDELREKFERRERYVSYNIGHNTRNN